MALNGYVFVAARRCSPVHRVASVCMHSPSTPGIAPVGTLSLNYGREFADVRLTSSCSTVQGDCSMPMSK